MKRFQSHHLISRFSVPCELVCHTLRGDIKFVTGVKVDKFFDQPANRLDGWLDSSPIAASTKSAESHVTPLDATKHKSDMPVNDLFDTTISKHCQTMAEVSQLTKSLNRPVKEDYEEDVSPKQELQPAPAPVSE